MASIEEINATVAAMLQAGSSFSEVRDFLEQSSVGSMDSASKEKIYSAYEEARTATLAETSDGLLGEKPEGEITSYGDSESQSDSFLDNPLPQTSQPDPAAPDPTEEYEVVGGDYLIKIAADNDTTVDALIELNPELEANPDLIEIGQTITLSETVIPCTPTTDATPAPDEALSQPEEPADPDYLAVQKQNYEDAATVSDQTEAAYVALKEEREALEAEIAAGGDTGTVAISADIEGDSLQAQLLAAKIAEEKALQVASDARMDLIEEGDVLDQAESLYSEQLAGEQAQADLDKAAGDAVTEVMTTDIMQGKDVSADSLEQLEAAAKQAYDTLTTAAQADDQGQYEKEQVENLEKLVEDTTELYETATTAYTEVQDKVVEEAERETKETDALIGSLYNEDGIDRDEQGNLTVGENLDTVAEQEAALAAIDEQIEDIESLLGTQTKEFVDVDGDGIQDPGEVVNASNAELLGDEAISDLEAQKAELLKLEGDIIAATDLIKATDALIAAGGDPNAKAMQSFWANAPKYDPKVQFRFKVMIGAATQTGMSLQDALGDGIEVSPSGDPYNDIPDDTNGNVWYAKSVDKPTIQLATFAENFYPTGYTVSNVTPMIETPTFSTISMVLVDPTYPNATRKLLRWFRRAGYNDTQTPATNKALGNLPAVKVFMDSIGPVEIQQLDSNGKPLETWTLMDAFPAEINFGKLDYSSSDLVEISIVWKYRSFKARMHVKGAEEDFTYFNNYQAQDAGGSGCEARYQREGKKLGRTKDQWKSRLPDGDPCK